MCIRLLSSGFGLQIVSTVLIMVIIDNIYVVIFLKNIMLS